MLFPQQGVSAEERRLLKLYRSLAASDRGALLAFGQFLAQRGGGMPHAAEPSVPGPLDRPGQESVVAAIKRLRRAYHMLEQGALLHETSFLMSAHVLQGRPAADVIDDLELLFARHYAAYRDGHPSAQPG
jgi:hypothetical protein